MIDRRNLVIGVLGSILAPFLAMTLYLLVSRSSLGASSPSIDYLAMAASLTLGAVLTLRMPMVRMTKVCLVIAQIAFLSPALYLYTFWLVGTVFDHWL